MAVLVLLPLALLIWVGGVIFGSIGIAEALERTGGLAPTTYGGAFWMATIFTAVMVALEVRAIVRTARRARTPSDLKRSPGPLWRLLTRPSTGLLFLFVPTILLVSLDLRGFDLPDVLTTAALLCCLGYVSVILPLAVLAASWRLARGLWRLGRRSGFASGLVGTLGLAFASCGPLVCALDGDSEGLGDRAPVPKAPAKGVPRALGAAKGAAKGKDLVDGSRAVMVELAEVIPNNKAIPWSGTGTGSTQSKDRFDECIETVFRNRETQSLRNETIVYFVRRGDDRALAEDLVQQSILELCLGHAKKPHDNLTTRLVWLTKKRRENEWRRQKRRSCAIEVMSPPYAAHWPSPEDSAEFLAVNRALCALPEVDAEILRKTASGFNATEIGRDLSPRMTAAAVRKRRQRALERLRAELQ